MLAAHLLSSLRKRSIAALQGAEELLSSSMALCVLCYYEGWMIMLWSVKGSGSNRV